MKAVFLHVVSEEAYPQVPPPKLINGRPLVFFRTYVGAASKAAQLGMITLEGLQKVIDSAENDLKSVSKDDSKWIELQVDLADAARTLSSFAL